MASQGLHKEVIHAHVAFWKTELMFKTWGDFT